MILNQENFLLYYFIVFFVVHCIKGEHEIHLIFADENDRVGNFASLEFPQNST